jgi:hypothetical protein
MKDRIKSMMPFGIIFSILFFKCYNFGGLERVNPFQAKKFLALFGMERFNPFQSKKFVAYEGQN